jgi:hypothetical protein
MGYWIGGIVAAVVVVLFLWGWISQRRLYGPHGHKRRPDIYVLAMHGKVKKHLSKVGFEGLSEAEKVCWSTVWLWRIVQLGGFENYYSEPYGDYAVEAAMGFEAIGARGYADIVRRANKLFENGRPGRIKELRVEQLRDMGEDGPAELVVLDEEFRGCKDDLDALLAPYIALHREEFLRK